MMKNEDKKKEIIRYMVSGKTVYEAMAAFNYKGAESIYGVMRKFKPMVADYASSHTLEETIKQFAAYELTEQWLVENGIECYTFDTEKLLNDYRNGLSLNQLVNNYDKSEDEIRAMLTDAHIPIREDEENTDFGEGHITIEEKATDIAFKSLPKLRRGDICFVNGAKYSWRKDKMPSKGARPVIILSPQWQLSSGSDCVTVCYGTTQTYRAEVTKDIILLNKYYTGKKFCCQLTQLDTISITDIQYNETYPHLNDADMARIEEGLANYFGIDTQQEPPSSELSENEISSMIMTLFENGLNRNSIKKVLDGSIYSCDKSLIQSVLDKNGYGGVKRITVNKDDNASVRETSDSVCAETTDRDIELIEAKAKLSVYENIFNKVSSISV